MPPPSLPPHCLLGTVRLQQKIVSVLKENTIKGEGWASQQSVFLQCRQLSVLGCGGEWSVHRVPCGHTGGASTQALGRHPGKGDII